MSRGEGRSQVLSLYLSLSLSLSLKWCCSMLCSTHRGQHMTFTFRFIIFSALWNRCESILQIPSGTSNIETGYPNGCNEAKTFGQRRAQRFGYPMHLYILVVCRCCLQIALSKRDGQSTVAVLLVPFLLHK